MTYVVYNTDTTRLLPQQKQTFATAGAAKAAKTRALNNGWIHEADKWAVAEYNDFVDNIEKMKTVKNLMSGKEIDIPVNTPLVCDPSSEAYWSM